MLRQLLRSLFVPRASVPRRKADAPRPPQPTRPTPSAAEGKKASAPRLALETELQRDRVLSRTDREIFLRVAERVEAWDLDLPRLPSSASRIMELAAQPDASTEDITEALSTDPTLCAELLKTANSAAYAGVRELESVRDAVVRLGTRTLRSLVLRASMRGTILRQKTVLTFAMETWRQAASVGQIARRVSRECGIDPEHGALLGLMHDIGKVALLAMIARETPRGTNLSSALFGQAFIRFHEPVGAAMARTWKLPEELIAVAGQHHDFRSNAGFPRSAALVSLCHKLDIFLAQGDEEAYRTLAYSTEMQVLGIAADRRQDLLTEIAEEQLGLRAAAA